jgi:hypothetical protein
MFWSSQKLQVLHLDMLNTSQILYRRAEARKKLNLLKIIIMNTVFTDLIPRIAKQELLTKDDVRKIYESEMCCGPEGHTYENTLDYNIYLTIVNLAICVGNIQNIANLIAAPRYFDRAAPDLKNALIYCAQYGSLNTFKYLTSIISNHSWYGEEMHLSVRQLKALARYNTDVRDFLKQYDSALKFDYNGLFTGLFKPDTLIPEVVFVNHNIGDEDIIIMYGIENLAAIKSVPNTRIYDTVEVFGEKLKENFVLG